MRRARTFDWWHTGMASIIVLVVSGCGSNESTTGPPPPPPPSPPSVNGLVVAAGDGQVGTVAAGLTEPLTVRVEDTSGQPVSGVSVSWSVVAGGGTLSSVASSSDASGLAAVSYTMGTTAGTQRVRATIAGTSTTATFTVTARAGPPATLAVLAGNDQAGPTGAALPVAYRIRVDDQYGNVVEGATVAWTVVKGGGSVAAASSVTDAAGAASVIHTLGPQGGGQLVDAAVQGTAVSPVRFHATARSAFAITSGGSNVAERFGSDLWIHGGYGYSGTWGNRNGTPGNAVKIWQLDPSGAPSLIDSVVTAGISTVSDVEVSADGSVLMFSTEGGPNAGLYIYRLTDPRSPTLVDRALVSTGLHTATFGYIGGNTYAFAAKNPGSPALLIYQIDATGPNPITLVSTTPIPPAYGIHDTFVRDGIAVVSAWDTGVILYDVGNGLRGGTTSTPLEISRIATANGNSHNGWWFHNPNTGERRYLFVGEEGPGVVGGAASGDIHVVDVSALSAPREVATFSVAGAGTHNFWMDEQAEVLYAAYYNAGIVAIDVSGDLSGDLTIREIARIQPGGTANTFTWGVQLYQGSVYAVDMLSGFWQLSRP